jgi:hypothetical protein
MALLVRMFAARDIILGELLLTSDRRTSNMLLVASSSNREDQADTREVHRALWCNIATDALDVVWLVIAFSEGRLGGKSAGVAAGAAAALALAGAETLWFYR